MRGAAGDDDLTDGRSTVMAGLSRPSVDLVMLLVVAEATVQVAIAQIDK